MLIIVKLTCLIAIIIYGLLAKHKQIRSLFLCYFGKELCYCKGLQLCICQHMDPPVSAHCKSCPELILYCAERTSVCNHPEVHVIYLSRGESSSMC